LEYLAKEEDALYSHNYFLSFFSSSKSRSLSKITLLPEVALASPIRDIFPLYHNPAEAFLHGINNTEESLRRTFFLLLAVL